MAATSRPSMFGAPKPLVHRISSPWSIRSCEHGYENCHQRVLSRGTHGKAKGQDVIVRSSTKGLFDEAVEALGAEVETEVSVLET